jgi:hypothetical protein
MPVALAVSPAQEGAPARSWGSPSINLMFTLMSTSSSTRSPQVNQIDAIRTSAFTIGHSAAAMQRHA